MIEEFIPVVDSLAPKINFLRSFLEGKMSLKPKHGHPCPPGLGPLPGAPEV